MNNSTPLPPVGGTSCVADLEGAVERILGRTVHGDCRPPYRNMATGKLSFPVLSPAEQEARENA